MAWLAVDRDGGECIYNMKPTRHISKMWWLCDCEGDDKYGIELPHGSIIKLIGKELTWEDEPVELE